MDWAPGSGHLRHLSGVEAHRLHPRLLVVGAAAAEWSAPSSTWPEPTPAAAARPHADVPPPASTTRRAWSYPLRPPATRAAQGCKAPGIEDPDPVTSPP